MFFVVIVKKYVINYLNNSIDVIFFKFILRRIYYMRYFLEERFNMLDGKVRIENDIIC